MEEAISYIMYFYNVTREAAIECYKDEIEAYIKCKAQFERESS